MVSRYLGISVYLTKTGCYVGSGAAAHQTPQVSTSQVVIGHMGDVILLSERRADRSRPAATPGPAFFYDLSCPFSYLTAERLERLLGEQLVWIPVLSLRERELSDRERRRAELLAAELRLPLVWPERPGAPVPSAMRAAAHASEVSAAAGFWFALAASRLAFCGGFDLADPEILAEVAASARLPLKECLTAARDRSWDRTLQATARGLRSRGARELPAVRLGRRLLYGESAVTDAAAILRWRALAGAPVAPAG